MQDNTETIQSDIVNTLEMLYDSCHLTRDNVNTDVRKILAKHLGGEYDKQITVDTMTEHHTIKFTLQLTDVVHLDYRAKHGETSFFCGVNKGVVTSKTEIRDESYYERMNNVVCVNTGITPFFDKSIILDSVISKPNPLTISKYF